MRKMRSRAFSTTVEGKLWSLKNEDIGMSRSGTPHLGNRCGGGKGIGNRDGDREVKVGVEDVSKVDELFKLLVGARGCADTVINITEEEVGDGASVAAEEGLFH
eukprot:g13955.t1